VFSAHAEGFRDQVRFLKLHYDVVSPRDLADIVRRRRGRYVLLTFDDAYLDNYSIAFPILRDHGVSATFFVATGFVDRRSLSWWDEIAWMVRKSPKHGIDAGRWFSRRVAFDDADREVAIRFLLTTYKALPADSDNEYLEFLAEATGSGRYRPTDDLETWMTWKMLREMRAAGMAVGGHTVNHPVLASLSPERQWEEISACGKRLEHELGEPMRYFSYPVGNRGSFNSDTRACLKKAGVQYAFSYYGGLGKFDEWDDLDVKRVAVVANMGLDWIRALVTLPGLCGRYG
jgi:peptidoglycan/xylan/chitin deacetylase (PgdA/CDA1 family)